MFKFVKVYCDHYKIQYDNWFLVIDGCSNLPTWEDELRFHQNMATQLLKEGLNGNSEIQPYIVGRFQACMRNPIDYGTLLQKYPGVTLLIREIGSWMTLNSCHNITDTQYSETTNFPVDTKSQIIICENDPFPEDWWVVKLEKQYPGKHIATLTNFYNRTVDEIRKSVVQAEIITFTTTFSRLDWFENLLKACEGIVGKTFIFHWTGDEHIWKNVYSQFKSQIDELQSSNTVILEK